MVFGPDRDGVWTLLGRCLDKMNASKLGSLQFHRRHNLYWGCLGSVLRVPWRCLDGVWILSGWCLDLIKKVSVQNEYQNYVLKVYRGCLEGI